MGQPTWNPNGKTVKVPDRPGSLWTLALDWLTAGKLYRLEVLAVVPPPAPPAAPAPNPVEQTWTPRGSSGPCTADGDASGLSRRDALLLPEARLGTLIAKIGGSTADSVVDRNITPLFTAGRYCVFKAPDDSKTGPLYLAVNDSPAAASGLTGSLDVVICESM